MAFGKEKIEVVGVADGQSKRIEAHRLAHRPVNATEVDNQPMIDEDPHIVIAGKAERLAGLIRESRMELTREREVVRLPFVAEQLIVDRKEIRIVVGVDAAPIVSQRNRDGSRLVVSRRGVIPLGEVLRGR